MTNRNRCSIRWAVAALLSAIVALAGTPVAAEGEFASTTIDLGVVVRDVQKSVDFYTQVVGFQEVEGFSVPADLAADAGLTDNHAVNVRVLVLGDEESATKLKLMQLPQAESQPSDNRFIHSQLGFSYLTIFVNDTTAAMARLEDAGVEPLARGPVALRSPLPEGVYLTVIRDPDGNLVELVGPKAND